MNTNKHFWSYLAQFFLVREIFQMTVVVTIRTHFVFSNIFRQSFLLCDNMEKYYRAG